jgi:hypothetical protein
VLRSPVIPPFVKQLLAAYLGEADFMKQWLIKTSVRAALLGLINWFFLREALISRDWKLALVVWIAFIVFLSMGSFTKAPKSATKLPTS